jgi:hypothetical protein
MKDAARSRTAMSALRAAAAARILGALIFVCMLLAPLGARAAPRGPDLSTGAIARVWTRIADASRLDRRPACSAPLPARTTAPQRHHHQASPSDQDTDEKAILPPRAPAPALALRVRATQGCDGKLPSLHAARPAASSLGVPGATSSSSAIEGLRIARALDRAAAPCPLEEPKSARGPPRRRPTP